MLHITKKRTGISCKNAHVRGSRAISSQKKLEQIKRGRVSCGVK